MAFEPSDGTTMYMAHYLSFERELDSLFPAQPELSYPAGIVFYAAFNKTLPRKIQGSYDLQQIIPILDGHPGMMPVLVSYLDGTTVPRINRGEFDQQIYEYATFLKELDRPVYISLGLEVGNPLFGIDPVEYTTAYRYMVRTMMNAGLDSVSYIWYVNGMEPNYQGRDMAEWYPGDAYVNWLGTSVYKLTEKHYADKEIFKGPNFDRLFEFAEDKDLPVMVVESGTQSYRNYYDEQGADLWQGWYMPYLQFLNDHPRVKAFSLRNIDLDDPVIEARWKKAMQENDWTYGSASLGEALRNSK